MAMKKTKTLTCRYCGDECDASNRDVLSGWTHNHPAVCPYRTDEMPSLNGVHVGDVWRNTHTGKESVVEAIKLGGCGTYTDREPVVVLRDERDSEYRWVSPTPLWSLVENSEPITRPGEYPVPWTRSKRWKGRSAHQKWRTPGYRGSSRKRQHAYWHAYHTVAGYSIEWERTNVLWQTDPKTELALEQAQRAREGAQELLDSGDELLAKVGAQMAEIFKEAA